MGNRGIAVRSIAYGLVVAVAGLAAPSPSAFCFAQAPRHLDLLVATSTGAIYAVDPQTGEVRSLVSGYQPYLTWPPIPTIRGSGPKLNSFASVIVNRTGRIFANANDASNKPLLIEVNPNSGDRTAIGAAWNNASDWFSLRLYDQRSAVSSTVSQLGPPNFGTAGTIQLVSLSTGSTTQIAGGVMQDGPIPGRPISVELTSRTRFFVADRNDSTNSSSAPAIFDVDLVGQRTQVLSVPWMTPVERHTASHGMVSSATTFFAPQSFGSGATCNDFAYPSAMAGGNIFLCTSTTLGPASYAGGLLQINTATGARELILGTALDSSGNVITAPPSSAPANFYLNPAALLENLQGEMLIGDRAARVYAWNLQTHAVRLAADIRTLVPNLSTGAIVRSLAVYTNCPADINLDGVSDDADFSPFAAAYDILDCSDSAMPIPCPSDLNADGVVDDADFTLFVAGYDALVCD